MKMMRLTRQLAPALFLGAILAPAVARAEVKNLTGQVAPDLGAVEQANGGDKITDLKSLKGKVVMLEFFATW